jgi:hypothetical protein
MSRKPTILQPERLIVVMTYQPQVRAWEVGGA